MNARRLPPAPKVSARGFSLVEVVMALGIFAFGIVALLGLVVVALDTRQDAKEDTVLAQIKQRLTAEILLTDGDRLQQLDGFSRIFDVEGRETREPGQAVYRAQVSLSPFTPPGGEGESESLQLAILFALRDPTPSGDVLDKAVANGLASGAILVAKAENAQAPSP